MNMHELQVKFLIMFVEVINKNIVVTLINEFGFFCRKYWFSGRGLNEK